MAFWSKKNEEVAGREAKKETPSTPQANSQTQKVVAAPRAADTKAPGFNTSKSPSQDSKLAEQPQAQQTLEQRFGRLRSALGPGTVIQGKLSFDTPVRIDGKLSGEVYSSSALIIGETGSVDAKLEVQSLIILGKVKGQVKAEKIVELHSSGSFEGDLDAPSLMIQDGAEFNGSCTMGHRPEKSEPKLKNPSATKGPVLKAGEQGTNGSSQRAKKEEAGEKRVSLH